MEDFIRRVHAALDERGLSIREVSRALHYDHAYLSRVLAGKQRPSRRMARRLDDLLGADGSIADKVTPRVPSQPSESREPTLADFLPDGDPLAPLKARRGRRIGAQDVSDLAARVHGLRLADDVIGGRDTLPRALRELRSAVALYREGVHTDEVGRALLAEVAELAQIAGWIASDAGNHADAENAYRLGLSAAERAGDATLAGQLLSTLSYQVANVGEPREAVAMAHAAVERARTVAPPRARALFFDRLAWAHTKAGDVQPAIRALSEAHEALTTRAPEPDPSWLYWVSEDELEIMDARVFTELHRPLRAVPLLSRVLDRYDAAHARELALYLSWLAMAYADANEPGQAAAVAERMFAMSASVASARTDTRADAVRTRLTEYREVPEVRSVLSLDHTSP
ncbi:helix-turn-helix domain-containing protein [Streptomyces sp. NPDC048172]|uniref:helix-turn-helix domain-containing protein n=1 Tax=Streptomyces sp. NPDC048172 TaxID=3365505 RepID=UPI003715F500